MDALDAAQHSRLSTDSVETAQTSADVMAETVQVNIITLTPTF